MVNIKLLVFSVAVVLGSAFSNMSHAQVSEDFTGTRTNNFWYFINGACLTARTSTFVTSPPPERGVACTASSYYDGNLTLQSSPYYTETLVGGQNGTLPDASGQGALRFTNGSPGGYHQNGAIVSGFNFPTSQGIQITFKTVTYLGDKGGAGQDGADGMSFYLIDANYAAGIGAWGGSLGYTCSNRNPPYDGLAGAYIGLGIDEYGNFLNGTNLMTGYSGSNSATGDNTALGYGYKPGRIGMRGAGSVSWNALTAAYGGTTNPGNSLPWYPASLATTCPVGSTYDSGTNLCVGACANPVLIGANIGSCASCPSGYTYSSSTDTCGKCSTSGYTYDSSNNTCWKCSSGYTYDPSSHTCSDYCASPTVFSSGPPAQCIDICSNGTFTSTPAPTGQCINICSTGATYDSLVTPHACESCPAGYTYTGVSGGSHPNKCQKNLTATYITPTATAPTTAVPTTGPFSSTGPTTSTVTSHTPTYTLIDHVPTSYTQAAVQNTCQTGHLFNYGPLLTNPSAAPIDVGTATLDNTNNTKGILDYAPIPNAYSELSSLTTPFTIASEGATTRTAATPIFYNLKITQDGLLSLSYSQSGGAYLPVIKNQSITASNGQVPANVLFAFAGSTGGSTNIHEIMCFKAAPNQTSGSSTSVNEKLAAKVEAGTQAYFAFYDQNNWTGAVTANNLIDTAGVVTVNTVANWDASCVLNGTTATGCATTGIGGSTTAQPTSASASGGRQILSWSGTQGVPFEWTATGTDLTVSQQSTLDVGDTVATTGPSPPNSNRLNYLRGDRTNEITTTGANFFRMRDGVLGDIIDSSPIWVGPPSDPYTSRWVDRLPANPSATPDPLPENSASQSYSQFVTAKQSRLNVVYGGANDGLLHGFRSGSFDATGNFVNNSSTPNDGQEVLAYMPAAVVQTIHNSTDPTLDYSNTQYGHNYYVDATPSADDLFYGGAWHTWLVGGLGPGGAAIYALDITDPSTFSEANAATIVIGEWGSTTISCATPGGAACGSNLGNTYGTPQIRRLHNGKWGVIFGNGFSSQTGDAGIYIMTVDPADASKTFYYLTTGTAAAGSNGIAYVWPADLDGDHITDYIYAGDLQGNVWRFDVTSTDPTQWAAAAYPLFTTNSGQPITTKLEVVAVTPVTGGSQQQVMVEFGTGQKTPLTNTSPTTYVSGTQSLYGVWDWNLSTWNASSTVKYLSLPASSAATGLSAPSYTLSSSNLQVQTFTPSTTSPGNFDGTSNTVCWYGLTLCGASASSNNEFGWYANLQASASEQVVFNPIFYQGALIVDSTVPANNVPTSCSVNQDTGFTYSISATTGGVIPNAFPHYHDLALSGVATSATGTPYVVTTVEGTTNIVYQTVSGTPGSQQLNLPSTTKAKRLTWVELR